MNGQTPQQVVIAPATRADVPELHRLMQSLAVFERYDRDFAVTRDMLTRQGFDKAPADFGAFVARCGSRLVGMLVFYDLPFNAVGRPVLYMKELYVDQDARGQGVGEKLMRAAAAHALQHGYHSIRWQVADWNRDGRRFYERLGATADPTWINYALGEEQLRALAGSPAPHPGTAGAHARALEAAHVRAREFLFSLAERRVAHATTPDAPEPPDGVGFEAALALASDRIAPWLSASAGPRYLGFVTGGVVPEALAADWLVSAWDQNLSNETGSIAVDVERKTVATLARHFGLAERMHGQFVSGATAANTVAMATAREWASSQRRGPPTVFAGSAHSSILKAMAITGIGRERLVPVRTLPGRTAVDPDALKAALGRHVGPAIVVASAGEVNTGDFDDMVALAAITKRHGAWLHVDGAFGLFAAFHDQLKHLVEGVELADSVTVDLHKWLNVPYDSAVVYTSRPDLQRQVFAASSAYLGDAPDPLHYTPENSRRFRAFPAWMVLAARGRRGIGEWVLSNCRLAQAFAREAEATGVLEVVGGVHLNVVSFASRLGDASERDRILARINASGECFMTPSQVLGRPVIRSAFSNWATTPHDLERIIAAVRAAV